MEDLKYLKEKLKRYESELSWLDDRPPYHHRSYNQGVMFGLKLAIGKLERDDL